MRVSAVLTILAMLGAATAANAQTAASPDTTGAATPATPGSTGAHKPAKPLAARHHTRVRRPTPAAASSQDGTAK